MKQTHSNKVSDAELISEYDNTKHIGKLAVKFGVPHITIWRRLHKLGITLQTVKTGQKIPIQEILNGDHPYFQTYKLNKRLLKEGIFENKCAICEITDWQGKPLTMQLDHINGCSHDHRLENLRFLCANCHTQTDTFCGKNI